MPWKRGDPAVPDFDSSMETVANALDEIERTLDQMLALAELSASGIDMDRAAMQKSFDRLQRKIDRIAAAISSAAPAEPPEGS